MFYNYFNRHDYDRTQTVVSLIEKAMEIHRDRTAVVYKGNTLTYGELDRLSGRVANFLTGHGAGKDRAVAILLQRGWEMIVAALGALRSGSAYQPLDPSYPDERLDFMIKDSEAPVLITDAALKERLPGFQGDILDIAALSSLPDMEGDYPLPDPDSLFILLYTSGSTGIPKGVMLEHRNLVNFIHWYTDYYEINEASRDAAYASFGFDAIMMNTYPVLCAGGQVHVIDEAIRTDFPVLKAYFEDNGITHCFITTQVGRQFAKLYPSCGALKHLSIGGETLVPVEPPKGYRLHNAYGPTECTIFTTCFEIDRLYDNVPIGRPLYNTRIYIVDEAGQQVENGQEGELWISGPQVGRGYLKRPEKTAEAFSSNPFSDEEGYDRVYHTGDIVIGSDDGNIRFVGRRDTQVKIRGFRIELSEVEGVVRQFPGIKDATVAAFDRAAGGKFIAAYVVSDEKVDTAALSDFIRQSKPPYMVPSAILQIESIPVNQNQKVDRKRLPVPDVRNENYEAPATEMERLLSAKMELVLELKEVGVNDDFFEIGGDSVTAIRYIMECGLPGVNTASLYKYRTPRRLASFCEGEGRDSSDMEKENAKALLEPQRVTYDQLALLRMQEASGDSPMFNEPYLFKLKNGTDTGRLKDVIERLQKHHPALRTRLVKNEEGDYLQRYDESLFTPVEVVQTTEAEFAGVSRTLVKPFDITGGGFMRAAIYRTEADAYLFLDIHHIISDGYSLKLLFDEINACMEDPGHVLPPDSYYRLAKRYNEARGQEAYREAQRYYRENYYERGGLDMKYAMLKPDHDAAENKGGMEIVPLPIPKSPQANQVFFMTAAAVAMAKYNGSDRAFLYWIHEGRDSFEDMSAFGYRVRTLPFYLIAGEGETSEQILRKAGEQAEFSKIHADYPFLSQLPSVSRLTRFVYQKNMLTASLPLEAAGEQIELMPPQEAAGILAIGIVDNDSDEKLLLGVKYSASVYERESILRFCDIYTAVAKKLLDPEAVLMEKQRDMNE